MPSNSYYTKYLKYKKKYMDIKQLGGASNSGPAENVASSTEQSKKYAKAKFISIIKSREYYSTWYVKTIDRIKENVYTGIAVKVIKNYKGEYETLDYYEKANLAVFQQRIQFSYTMDQNFKEINDSNVTEEEKEEYTHYTELLKNISYDKSTGKILYI